MSNEYHQLAYGERCQIQVLLSSGKSQREIAKLLNRDPGTISREVARNRGQRGYRHWQAEQKAACRRQEVSSVPRKMTPDRWQVIEDRLREGWSPEQIAGRARVQGEEMASHEWIYQYIRRNRKEGGDLYRLLRRRGKKPNWRGGRHAGRGHIPARVDLSERPQVVEEKVRIGDRELDTIIGARRRGALLSSVDRASRYTVLEWLEGKTSKAVSEALIRRMRPLQGRVLTCTADNGKEFAGHQAIAAALQAEFCFATPCHSRERGRNEHTNGLVRQYFPKGTDPSAIRPQPVQAVEDRLHHRPRKCLGYRTPHEVFHGLDVA